jgi:hypothetical protein
VASLVAPLVSGISTAASGSAEFYRAGTSTAATVYSDSEGETQVTSHALDARGGVVRYVEERVDVVVRDLDGASVLTFTWGTDAREARVENLGWTGPDGDGQTIAGGRTTVDAVLTTLANSLGTTNGNVLVNGVAQTLSAALSSSAGLVFNVKSGYGAIGDGTTDDSGAIQDALNAAAEAGGGIIYFPHGTYLIGTGLVVDADEGKMMFLGEGSGASILRQGVSGTTMLQLGDGNENILIGMAFDPSNAANTGTLVSGGDESRAMFLGCTFAAFAGTHYAATAATRSTFHGCKFTITGATARLTSQDGKFFGCDFELTAGTTAVSANVDIFLVGCRVHFGPAAGASGTVIFTSSSGPLVVSGGEVLNGFASGSVTIHSGTGELSMSGVDLSSSGGAVLTLAGASTELKEAGCIFQTVASTFALGGDPEGSASQHRDHRVTSSSGSATSYTPDGSFAVHHLTSSGASMAINDPSPAVWEGASLLILYKNTSGGAVTPTFPGGGYAATTAFGSVDHNKTGVYFFVKKGSGITGDLINIAPQAAGGYTL